MKNKASIGGREMIGLNRIYLLLAVSLLATSLSAPLALNAQPHTESGARVLVLTVDGAIGPVTSEYILKGLKYAQDSAAQLVVIQLDTPGGLVTTTREIIKSILASPVPVAIYVAPNGARAASAGTYMLYAAHVAAMAPATTIGSATPVQMGGFPGMPDKPGPTPGGEGKEDQPEQPDSGADKTADSQSTMERKIINDAAAYIRSLAELRGRNAEWAEKAVREAVDLTASEAVQQNVADLIAEDMAGLLAAIHGRTVKVDQQELTLNTQAAQIEYLEPDWRTKFLTVITDPNIIYILILLAFYGLVYEFLNPGMFIPGVIGGISLLLALYAMQILPVNYAGLALMLLGILFMVAEAFAPSFGILGVGGIVAFTVGSVMLLDEDGYSVSLPIIIGNAIVSAVFFIWVLGMVVRIRRRPNVSGKESLLGAVAEATMDFEKEGYVRVLGESWKAVSDMPVQKGQKVSIKSVDGLVLQVKSNSK
jgi:membrane-bound serine protease (ClpP class)